MTHTFYVSSLPLQPNPCDYSDGVPGKVGKKQCVSCKLLRKKSFPIFDSFQLINLHLLSYTSVKMFYKNSPSIDTSLVYLSSFKQQTMMDLLLGHVSILV